MKRFLALLLVMSMATSSTVYANTDTLLKIKQDLEIEEKEILEETSISDEEITKEMLTTILDYSEGFLGYLLDGDYEKASDVSNGLLSAKDFETYWDMMTASAGEFKAIDDEKYHIDFGYSEQIGSYAVIEQYAEFEYMGIITSYYYNTEGQLIGIYFNFYSVDDDVEVPVGIEETDYKIGVKDTQDAKLTKKTGSNSDTVVLLVSGSGPNDLDANAYGNTPFRDIAWGLADAGIDTFRFDKVTNSISNGEMMVDDPEHFTVQDEYLTDVKEATEMLKEMGYKNIYLLGHSLGGMLAPRLYEDNDGVYAGVIILAGTTRTLTDVGIDQTTNAINKYSGLEKAQYKFVLNKQIRDIEKIDTFTEEELINKNIFNMSAYYIKDINSFDTASSAKNIDKPFLILQGSEDFQIFADKDYTLWQEVLKDNEDAEFKLYDGLGHFFTKAPENPNNDIGDYIPPQKIDERVIEDIISFINTKKKL